MPSDNLPRPFGDYLLTAALGEDALGRVYRALRRSGDRGFVRLRLLETPELPADAVIDAIEESGEVHGFLKNPAIARGVEMDAVDGVPFIAWNEPSGRTLTALSAKCRMLSRRLPVEHALLIAEKVATALDHAYNTTIDGDRTLHGLVWPGFVVISDDGEIRLAGFGLAAGVRPSLGKPLLASQIAPYVAPEERSSPTVGKTADVYSVGAMLFELLTGQPLPPDPFAALRGAPGSSPTPILPEIQALLRMTLGPAETRYKSSGDLRRELGKLLFSGPYSPSTFNLAYFLNDLFRDEIEAETRARKRETGLDEGAAPGARHTVAVAAAAASEPSPPGTPPRAAEAAPPSPEPKIELPRIRVRETSRRNPAALAGLLVAAAAVAGGIYVVSRRAPAPAPSVPRATTRAPTPTTLPELQATPSAPTTQMTEDQFREEVSRRLAAEVQKLEAEMKKRAPAAAPAAVSASLPTPEAAPDAIPTAFVPAPTEAPTAAPAPAVTERIAPTVAPVPTRIVVREGSLVAFEDVDSPPRIATIVKPLYPPLELRARIGGIVVLRVLVSERGAPADVQVLRGVRPGLDAAAVAAVRRWTFTPAMKQGVPVRTWMTVPIPFEP